MSSLADALAAEKAAFKKGPACTVGSLIDKLDKADAAALRAYLDDVDVPSSAIYRALRSEGHRVGEGAIQRHRQGKCLCARTT